VYDLELAKDEIASNARFIEQANQLIAEKVEESSSEDSKNKLLSFKEEQQTLEKNKAELQASLKELAKFLYSFFISTKMVY